MMMNNAFKSPELNRQNLNTLFPTKDYIPVQILFVTERINEPGRKYYRLPKSKVAYSMGSLNITIGDLTIDELYDYVDQTMEDSIYEGNILDIKIEEPPNYQNYQNTEQQQQQQNNPSNITGNIITI